MVTVNRGVSSDFSYPKVRESFMRGYMGDEGEMALLLDAESKSGKDVSINTSKYEDKPRVKLLSR